MIEESPLVFLINFGSKQQGVICQSSEEYSCPAAVVSCFHDLCYSRNWTGIRRLTKQLSSGVLVVACLLTSKSGSQSRVQGNTKKRHVNLVKNHTSFCTKMRSQLTEAEKGLIQCLLRHMNIYLVFLILGCSMGCRIAILFCTCCQPT